MTIVYVGVSSFPIQTKTAHWCHPDTFSPLTWGQGALPGDTSNPRAMAGSYAASFLDETWKAWICITHVLPKTTRLTRHLRSFPVSRCTIQMKFVDSIFFPKQNASKTWNHANDVCFGLLGLDCNTFCYRPSARMLKSLARHCALAFSGPALVPCWVCLGSSQVRHVFFSVFVSLVKLFFLQDPFCSIEHWACLWWMQPVDGTANGDQRCVIHWIKS